MFVILTLKETIQISLTYGDFYNYSGVFKKTTESNVMSGPVLSETRLCLAGVRGKPVWSHTF